MVETLAQARSRRNHSGAAGQFAGYFCAAAEKRGWAHRLVASRAQIYNRIRGLRPWPGAFTLFRGKSCHIWGKPVSGESSGGEPAGPERLRIEPSELSFPAASETALRARIRAARGTQARDRAGICEWRAPRARRALRSLDFPGENETFADGHQPSEKNRVRNSAARGSGRRVRQRSSAREAGRARKAGGRGARNRNYSGRSALATAARFSARTASRRNPSRGSICPSRWRCAWVCTSFAFWTSSGARGGERIRRTRKERAKNFRGCRW